LVLMQHREETQWWWSMEPRRWRFRRLFTPRCTLCCWASSWSKAGEVRLQSCAV